VAETATPAAGWHVLAAPDRHPLNRSVPEALSPFIVRRPASTMTGHPTTRVTASTT
jgi:hypothetical protein